ncbi:DUF192 domain-containing protein [Haloplanus halophilus]|uniref:DUF192 domain-containing protein n=1 Tax=Haloplanus halophilus TaxID=2949993 RepID=UPI00203C1C1C|nr:DUF192 domain-containing protein [Haloplanus sp. GDY1]
MSRRATLLAVGLLALVTVAGCAGAGGGPDPTATDTTTATDERASTPVSTPGSSYETTTVYLVDENGTRLAAVDVWVADTFPKRYVGLSDTTALEPGQGMLFVHDDEARHAYVMRDMDFPLDMVFVAANGTVTTIHHAPLESDGDLTEYAGRSKYVLEVPMGYTNRTGVDVGDRLRIEDR